VIDGIDPTRDAESDAHYDADEAEHDDVLESIAPLCSPPQRATGLSTELYDCCEDLENDLREFAAKQSQHQATPPLQPPRPVEEERRRLGIVTNLTEVRERHLEL